MTLRFFLIGLLIWLSPHILHAQMMVIEGKLTDAMTKEPVPYASVSVVGYTLGTSSNADGSFTLKIPESLSLRKFALKISCIGYENAIIKNPGSTVAVELKAAATLLNEVVVFSITPKQIMMQAFANVNKNYYTKPFVYKSFYRHYCKDDSAYGRLIEAAVDIYKRKGYRSSQATPGLRDEVRVNQLRRSFDNTKVNSHHVPISIYNVMGTDFVGFQSTIKTTDDWWIAGINSGEISGVQYHPDFFEYELKGLTVFDNEEVYEIRYTLKKDTIRLSSGLSYKMSMEGSLFITTKTFAVIKASSVRKTPVDTLRSTALYKRTKDKYFLYHAIRDGQSFNKVSNFHHKFHIELVTTDVVTRNFKKFKGREPGKEALLAISYDSVFWNNYNSLKATPLEEKIVEDLEKKSPLNDQFREYVETERERLYSGKEDEDRFNRFLKENKGRVIYIDIWASWCGPCLSTMAHSRRLVEKYKLRIAFVYLSFDDDAVRWKAALKKYKMTSEYMFHFRVGASSDVQKLFDVDQIPRCILVARDGSFADHDARRPDDPALEADFQRLLCDH